MDLWISAEVLYLYTLGFLPSNIIIQKVDKSKH